MIIIGIDPGTNVMGHAVIETHDDHGPSLIEMNVEKFKPRLSHYARLVRIFEAAERVLTLYHPDVMAIEAPFYGKNVQAMLRLGRGQGVAMLAAASREIDITEYEPRRIKQTVTGNGAATKEQVRDMLTRQILIPSHLLDTLTLDATDALAAAMCHYYETKNAPVLPKPRSKTAKPSSWASFVNRNQDRLLKQK